MDHTSRIMLGLIILGPLVLLTLLAPVIADSVRLTIGAITPIIHETTQQAVADNSIVCVMGSGDSNRSTLSVLNDDNIIVQSVIKDGIFYSAGVYFDTEDCQYIYLRILDYRDLTSNSFCYADGNMNMVWPVFGQYQLDCSGMEVGARACTLAEKSLWPDFWNVMPPGHVLFHQDHDGRCNLTWQSIKNEWSSVMTSTNLYDWNLMESVLGNGFVQNYDVPLTDDPIRFYKIGN